MNRETHPRTSRHGEFKTPGGKLVVVDFTVTKGQLEGVQITGDFFLYPEDVLSRLNAALEGTVAAESREGRIAGLNASLEPGDVLVGLSSEAISIAVERALASS